MRSIPIFRPGQHTSAAGAQLTFSESDLAASVAAYDPALHEAPVVVGHPRHDLPAYGWVRSLAFADGELQAEPHQVDPAFAELVTAGRYKKVSAAFYAPDSPQNPVPGVYYLRHVGFLGAQPPAIKGLRSVQFADAEDGVIEFADWSDQQQAGLWRRMREFLIAQFGLDKADQVIPSYTVDALAEEAMREAEPAQPRPMHYSEGDDTVTLTPEQLAARKAELDAQAAQLAAQEADLKERATAFAEAEAKTAADKIKAEALEFAESLVQAGQLRPADKDRVVGLLVTMPAATVIEFAEGSDTPINTPASEVFKAFLKAMPKSIDFSERAGGAVTDVDLSSPDGIRAAAVEFQEAERAAGREVPSIELAIQTVCRQA